jgi:predicted peptidase
MTHRLFSFAFAFALAFIVRAAAAEPEIVPPSVYTALDPGIATWQERLARENPERFEAHTTTRGDRMVRYRWFAPETEERLPLVIVLHGSSGKGNDNLTHLITGNSVVGAGWWATPRWQGDQPCFVLAPQCPAGEMWTRTASWTSPVHPLSPDPAPALADLMGLLDELLAAHPIDPARVYLIGASMGGYGVWDWIVRAPDRFAAAIAICGGMPEGQAEKLRDLPLWIFHGENDGIVPVEESRRAFREILAAGGRPRYREYQQGPHGVSSYAYLDAGVAEWLFAQRRKGG